MFGRPRAGETEEDLMRQQEQLVAQGKLQPSVKLVRPDKRKTEDGSLPEPANNDAPRSKFAQDRANKKKKEGIKDQTILAESVHRIPRAAVLGRVVEREAALRPSPAGLAQWCPQPSPHGFPQPRALHTLADDGTENSGVTKGKGRVKKSLYMRELERQGLAGRGRVPTTTTTTTNNNTAPPAKQPPDPSIAALGSSSVIIQGDDVLKDKSEVDKIHQENLNRLSAMSHEERMREREELLSCLSGEQIAFLRSLRQGSGKQARGSIEAKPGCEVTPMECSDVEVQERKVKEEGIAGKIEDNRDGKHTEEKMKVESHATSEEEEKQIKSMKEVKMEENTTLSDLPITPQEAEKWVHMDKVEMEKLQWMTSMPPPKPLKDNEGFVARFNFKGDILPYSADISYRQALHHHGEEPGRPGYTLDEIFVMVRSQVLQQRHQGLQMLANIFRNAKEGLYDHCTNPPLIQLAIEAGAVLLLRFALDDPSHLVYREAVRGLHHLVASDPDELCLALAHPWIPGDLEPGVASEVHASDKTRQELDKEEQDLRDHEVIKLDVVRALVRMDTLVRLRYLLEKVQPEAQTVIDILGVLTRMARHSLTAAWSLASTPKLLSIILDSFLPHNVSSLLTGTSVASMSSVYGVPLRHALQMLRVLAAKGRQLAALLVNTYQVMDRLLVYVSMEPSEVSLPLQEALMLSQEAYSLWSVLLTYGLTKPVEAVASFYPMFVKQLVFYRDKVPLNQEQENNKFNYDVGAQMVAVLGRAVEVAATHSLLEARARLNQGTVAEADGKMVVLPPPPLTWAHLQDLPHLVETCLAKWLSQLARDDCRPTFSGLRLIGSCCTFLMAYYSRWKDQTSYNHQECLARTENLYNTIISPFISSPAFMKLLATLPHHSSLCSSLQPGTSRDPINLGSLGCITLGGTVVPLIQPSSPFPLLVPFSSLLLTLNTLHPALIHPTPDRLLESEQIATYLEKLCVSPRHLAPHWLTRAEVYFLANILQLAGTSGSVGSARKVLFHEAALSLLPCIHKGDEHLLKELLIKVICVPEFTCDLAEVAQGIDDMSLSDYEPLKSPALHQPALNASQMTSSVFQSLASIGNELASALVTKKELAASLVLAGRVPFATNSITISHVEDRLILDQFWPLTPLKYAFRDRWKPQKEGESTQSKPEDILTVTRCLQMAYMGLKHRSRILLPPSASSHSSWLQHLSLAFLSASDLFLDPTISSYLQGCVVELLRRGGYAKMTLQQPIDGFSSTSDWYRSLVDQYQAVSYGDSTFALFLIVPLQQHCPKEFRTTLWGDACNALQFLYLRPEQVKRFIPLEQFLAPPEEDEGLITRYRAAIGTSTITAKRNPLMHTIAEHHAHLFLSHAAEMRRAT
ncbi:RNA polymerase II-associated protein 1-like isoform X1 [Scylla paramamosain]|uniref:RNA polymerase II-associated protein 1-like isoform X1 n=2 Tax=Scylla paramamosain TaxID=85552 RepID=UPI00308285F9